MDISDLVSRVEGYLSLKKGYLNLQEYQYNNLLRTLRIRRVS